MLGAIKELGLLVGERKPYDEISADKVLVLDFDKEGGFKGVDLEDFSEDKLPLYLYKKAKGKNPPSLTPTLMLTGAEKSLKHLERAVGKLKKAENSIPNLGISPDLAEIIKDAVDKLPPKTKVLLTVRIDGKYIGEIKEFIRALEKVSAEEGKDSRGKAICSVCLEEKDVSGDISPFKFYTIDKPGYITGGFNKKEAFKNFPLCYECKALIYAGKQFLEKSLKFSFIKGMSYYLIPEFIYGRESVREEILQILKDTEFRKHKLSSKEFRHLTADEEDILEILSEERDVLTVHLLFLEREQGAERILLHIQDIYPSRLKELFSIKEYIEKNIWDGGQEFTYETIYNFFSKTDPSKKYFLEVVDKTFRGIPLDKKFLIKFLLSGIRKDFEKDQFYSVIKDAFGVFLFILISTGEEEMKDFEPKSLEELLNSMPALDTNLKRGLFLLGALTERLLRVQRKERDSAPFMKKLKGLRMNENDLKGLLPQVRNKLEEYESFKKGENILFELVSEYLSKAGRWNMSIEEMNFYFVLGMGMFDKVKEFILYRREEEDGNRGDS